MLADEPTANLDTTNGKSLVTLMKRLNVEFGTTFIISSHDPDVIDSAGRLVLLTDGRVVQAEDNTTPPLPPDAACPPEKPSLKNRLLRTFAGDQNE